MKKASFAVCILLLLASCEEKNQFELSKDNNGNTIRLNKKTGEISIVENGKISPIKNASEVDSEKKQQAEIEAAKLNKLEDAKVWLFHSAPSLGNATAYLTTSWRDDSIHYQFVISPVTPQLQAKRDRGAYEWLSIELNDTNGFKLGTLHMPFRELSLLLNEKGEATSLQANSKEVMARADYERITSWNLFWSQ